VHPVIIRREKAVWNLFGQNVSEKPILPDEKWKADQNTLWYKLLAEPTWNFDVF
jgi:hypothetical protein